MIGAGSYKDRLVTWAKALKAELYAVSRAARDPRTPRIARVIAILLVAYAASPIDLIPDFIPIFGMVDDLIILPLGIALVLKFIPPEVMAEHRARSTEESHVPSSRAGLVIVVVLWLAGLLGLAALMHRWFR